MLMTLNTKNPEKRKIEEIIQVLESGGIIAYPTDTSFGIGCDLKNKKAVEKIYKILNLPKNKNLSFLCPNLSNVSEYAVVSNLAYKTMKRLAPGSYTFILEASKTVPLRLLSKRKEVGIRIPNDNICQGILEKLGRPVISTTAKNSKGEYFLDAQEIYDELGKLIDIVIDPTEMVEPQGLSTVIDFSNDEVTLIRKGLGDYSWIVEE
jgi:tRNA threonylcarbamoyl adenosine modification protein (Sua5/YciO/YrdC/YwlC family)